MLDDLCCEICGLSDRSSVPSSFFWLVRLALFSQNIAVPCVLNGPWLMFICLTVLELSHYYHVLLVSHKPVRQISLSSLGNFRASGVSTLRVPDCSSELGRYVPSVCLFFFTTQSRNTRTAVKIASSPKTTVGTTIATILGPWFWTKEIRNVNQLEQYNRIIKKPDIVICVYSKAIQNCNKTP